jgi:BirA family biotin operon repressor/biotin-[acetyl-CoA-carboxylase] ligase
MRGDSTFAMERFERHAWLRGVEVHDEIASTNVRACELAGGAEVVYPYLIVARAQTAGRGRGANRWWSANGALTFSLLLEPEALGLRSELWPRTSLCAALAVRETLAERAPAAECGIKWPNDVYLAARKVSGVLVEAPPRRESQPHRLVIGIGVNVNNSLAEAPSEVRALATSLVDQAGAAHDLAEVLESIVSRLAANLTLLAEDSPELPAHWQRHSLLDGRTVTIDLGVREVTGYCLGINAQGALDLATSLGVEAITSGVVKGISPDFRAR